MADRDSPTAVNLRRLMAWHGLEGKDMARLLGAAEHSVSGWATGRREPGARYLKDIAELFGIPMLWGDPDKVGLEIADPRRYHEAEKRIRRAGLKAVD